MSLRARTYRALFLSVLVALGLSLCALVPYALAAEPALPVAQAAESGSTPSGTASAADQAEPSSAERGDPDDPVYQFAFNLGYALAYVLVVLFLVIPPLAIAVAVYALVSKRRMAKRVPPVMMPPAAAPPQVGPPLAGPYAGGGRSRRGAPQRGAASSRACEIQRRIRRTARAQVRVGRRGIGRPAVKLSVDGPTKVRSRRDLRC